MERLIYTPYTIAKPQKNYTKVSFYFFLYSIFLILPGIFYTMAPNFYRYFFYGRFILFGIVTAFIFLIIKPSLARWDRTVVICWIIISSLYIVRNIDILNIEGILFGINIIWHIFIMMTLLNSRFLITEARKGLIWGAITLVVVSLFVSFLFPNFQIVSEVGGYQISRYGGLLYNAQQIAPYTVIVFIYLFSLFLSKKNKYFHIILLFPTIMMTFLSGSRIGISLLFFSAILIIFLQKKIKITVFLICLLIFIISLATLIDLNLVNLNIWSHLVSFHDKYMLRGNPDDFWTLGYRTMLWEFGMDKFWESPIIGHGYKSIGPFSTSGFGMQEEFMAHNGFLMVALYIGLLGLIPLYILLLRALFLGIAKAIRGDRNIFLALAFVIFGILANTVEAWILSFGYLPCLVMWLSVAEISIKEKKVS